MISLILLVMGAAGFIGTVLIDRILQKGFYQTLVVIALLMAAIALVLVAFGSVLTIVVVLLGLWGLLGTAQPRGLVGVDCRHCGLCHRPARGHHG